jgi:uncharacterized protein (DUF952 family)
MIYHVISKPDWEAALEQGFYAPPSLAAEGFIHNSTLAQVKGVVERYYKGREDLLLLHIEEDKLTAPLIYELAPSVNEEFPHIFGKLNIDAVVKITSYDNMG